jgi:hypothetical protein
MLPGKRSTRVGEQILRFVAELLMTRVREPAVKECYPHRLKPEQRPKKCQDIFQCPGLKGRGKAGINRP